MASLNCRADASSSEERSSGDQRLRFAQLDEDASTTNLRVREGERTQPRPAADGAAEVGGVPAVGPEGDAGGSTHWNRREKGGKNAALASARAQPGSSDGSAASRPSRENEQPNSSATGAGVGIGAASAAGANDASSEEGREEESNDGFQRKTPPEQLLAAGQGAASNLRPPKVDTVVFPVGLPATPPLVDQRSADLLSEASFPSVEVGTLNWTCRRCSFLNFAGELECYGCKSRRSEPLSSKGSAYVPNQHLPPLPAVANVDLDDGDNALGNFTDAPSLSPEVDNNTVVLYDNEGDEVDGEDVMWDLVGLPDKDTSLQVNEEPMLLGRDDFTAVNRVFAGGVDPTLPTEERLVVEGERTPSNEAHAFDSFLWEIDELTRGMSVEAIQSLPYVLPGNEQRDEAVGFFRQFAMLPIDQWPVEVRRRLESPGNVVGPFVAALPETAQIRELASGEGKDVAYFDSDAHELEHICFTFANNFASDKNDEAVGEGGRLKWMNDQGLVGEKCLRIQLDLLKNIAVEKYNVPGENADLLVPACTAFLNRTMVRGRHDWHSNTSARNDYDESVARTDALTREVMRKLAQLFADGAGLVVCGDPSYEAVIGEAWLGGLGLLIPQTGPVAHPAKACMHWSPQQECVTAVDVWNAMMASALGRPKALITEEEALKLMPWCSIEGGLAKAKKMAKDKGDVLWGLFECEHCGAGVTTEGSIDSLSSCKARAGRKACNGGPGAQHCRGRPVSSNSKKSHKHTNWKALKIIECLNCCKEKTWAMEKLAEYGGCFCYDCKPDHPANRKRKHHEERKEEKEERAAKKQRKAEEKEERAAKRAKRAAEKPTGDRQTPPASSPASNHQTEADELFATLNESNATEVCGAIDAVFSASPNGSKVTANAKWLRWKTFRERHENHAQFHLVSEQGFCRKHAYPTKRKREDRCSSLLTRAMGASYASICKHESGCSNVQLVRGLCQKHAYPTKRKREAATPQKIELSGDTAPQVANLDQTAVVSVLAWMDPLSAPSVDSCVSKVRGRGTLAVAPSFLRSAVANKSKEEALQAIINWRYLSKTQQEAEKTRYNELGKKGGERLRISINALFGGTTRRAAAASSAEATGGEASTSAGAPPAGKSVEGECGKPKSNDSVAEDTFKNGEKWSSTEKAQFAQGIVRCGWASWGKMSWANPIWTALLPTKTTKQISRYANGFKSRYPEEAKSLVAAHEAQKKTEGVTTNTGESSIARSASSHEESHQAPPNKKWRCDVCRVAVFDTYEEAVAHEAGCRPL